MKSVLSGAIALLMLVQSVPAACAPAQAASSFPVVPVTEPATHSHLAAYLCIGSGVALTAGSFVIAKEADRRYDEYLAETDPGRIESLYTQTVHLDRWSRATLIGGQVLIVTGLYLRFLRRAPSSRVGWIVAPDRCALALHF